MTGKNGKTEFARFERLMSNLRGQGISRLSLLVAYNQAGIPTASTNSTQTKDSGRG